MEIKFLHVEAYRENLEFIGESINWKNNFNLWIQSFNT